MKEQQQCQPTLIQVLLEVIREGDQCHLHLVARAEIRLECIMDRCSIQENLELLNCRSLNYLT